MKAIILARVSTEEQKEAGNSLPAQVARLENYCQRKGFEIVKTYSFDESAYKSQRDDFDKAVEYIKASEGKLAVCFDKVDRFSRDVFDKRVGFLYDLAMLDKIELHFASDNLVINSKISAAEKFQFGINLNLAKYYSDAISDNVWRAIEQKLRNGEWPGKAPIGYRNFDREDGKKWIEPDEKRDLVVFMFNEHGTGNYSLFTLRKAINNEFGISMPKGQIWYILKNPFYCGEMLYSGRIYPHAYEPIITKELYNRVQDVLSGYHKKPFKYGSKPFPYGHGLMTCLECGCAVTAEEAKGHHYYHCTQYRGKHGAEWVTEEELTNQFSGLLKGMVIPEPVLEQLVSALQTSHEGKKEFHNRRMADLKREHTEIEGKIEKAFDLLLGGSITQDLYDKKLKEFDKRKQELIIEMEQHDKASETYYINASTVLKLAGRAFEIFESSKVEEKRQLLGYLLQNCGLRGRKLEFTLKKPFDVILDHAKSENWLPGMDSNHRPSA